MPCSFAHGAGELMFSVVKCLLSFCQRRCDDEGNKQPIQVAGIRSEGRVVTYLEQTQEMAKFHQQAHNKGVEETSSEKSLRKAYLELFAGTGSVAEEEVPPFRAVLADDWSERSSTTPSNYQLPVTFKQNEKVNTTSEHTARTNNARPLSRGLQAVVKETENAKTLTANEISRLDASGSLASRIQNVSERCHSVLVDFSSLSSRCDNLSTELQVIRKHLASVSCKHWGHSEEDVTSVFPRSGQNADLAMSSESLPNRREKHSRSISLDELTFAGHRLYETLKRESQNGGNPRRESPLSILDRLARELDLKLDSLTSLACGSPCPKDHTEVLQSRYSELSDAEKGRSLPRVPAHTAITSCQSEPETKQPASDGKALPVYTFSPLTPPPSDDSLMSDVDNLAVIKAETMTQTTARCALTSDVTIRQTNLPLTKNSSFAPVQFRTPSICALTRLKSFSGSGNVQYFNSLADNQSLALTPRNLSNESSVCSDRRYASKRTCSYPQSTSSECSGRRKHCDGKDSPRHSSLGSVSSLDHSLPELDLDNVAAEHKIDVSSYKPAHQKLRRESEGQEARPDGPPADDATRSEADEGLDLTRTRKLPVIDCDVELDATTRLAPNSSSHLDMNEGNNCNEISKSLHSSVPTGPFSSSREIELPAILPALTLAYQETAKSAGQQIRPKNVLYSPEISVMENEMDDSEKEIKNRNSEHLDSMKIQQKNLSTLGPVLIISEVHAQASEQVCSTSKLEANCMQSCASNTDDNNSAGSKSIDFVKTVQEFELPALKAKLAPWELSKYTISKAPQATSHALNAHTITVTSNAKNRHSSSAISCAVNKHLTSVTLGNLQCPDSVSTVSTAGCIWKLQTSGTATAMSSSIPPVNKHSRQKRKKLQRASLRQQYLFGSSSKSLRHKVEKSRRGQDYSKSSPNLQPYHVLEDISCTMNFLRKRNSIGSEDENNNNAGLTEVSFEVCPIREMPMQVSKQSLTGRRQSCRQGNKTPQCKIDDHISVLHCSQVLCSVQPHHNSDSHSIDHHLHAINQHPELAPNHHYELARNHPQLTENQHSKLVQNQHPEYAQHQHPEYAQYQHLEYAQHHHPEYAQHQHPELDEYQHVDGTLDQHSEQNVIGGAFCLKWKTGEKLESTSTENRLFVIPSRMESDCHIVYLQKNLDKAKTKYEDLETADCWSFRKKHIVSPGKTRTLSAINLGVKKTSETLAHSCILENTARELVSDDTDYSSTVTSPSLPAEQKEGSVAMKNNGTEHKEESVAMKNNGTEHKEESVAMKNNGTEQKEGSVAMKINGTEHKEESVAMKNNGAEHEEGSVAMNNNGTEQKEGSVVMNNGTEHKEGSVVMNNGTHYPFLQTTAIMPQFQTAPKNSLNFHQNVTGSGHILNPSSADWNNGMLTSTPVIRSREALGSRGRIVMRLQNSGEIVSNSLQSKSLLASTVVREIHDKDRQVSNKNEDSSVKMASSGMPSKKNGEELTCVENLNSSTSVKMQPVTGSREEMFTHADITQGRPDLQSAVQKVCMSRELSPDPDFALEESSVSHKLQKSNNDYTYCSGRRRQIHRRNSHNCSDECKKTIHQQDFAANQSKTAYSLKNVVNAHRIDLKSQPRSRPLLPTPFTRRARRFVGQSVGSVLFCQQYAGHDRHAIPGLTCHHPKFPFSIRRLSSDVLVAEKSQINELTRTRRIGLKAQRGFEGKLYNGPTTLWTYRDIFDQQSPSHPRESAIHCSKRESSYPIPVPEHVSEPVRELQ